jgi:hypothetical protein
MKKPSRRDRRNQQALCSLLDQVTDAFPNSVWRYTLSRRDVLDSLAAAVSQYWHAHPVRADSLARALAGRSGAPLGWSWTLDVDRRDGLPTHFRRPPAPYREEAFSRGHGSCCVCGQSVYRYGWHRDLWADGRPSRRATWHQACVVAWKLWSDPGDFAPHLKRRQGQRCVVTNKRLLRSAHVDHRVPLYQVWREHREAAWPALLSFWGTPNLQVINREAHHAKCAAEARERAGFRSHGGEPRIHVPEA